MENERKASSFIKDVMYNSDSKVLTVEFNRGTKTSYLNVPGDLADNFVKAPSLGVYFNCFVKGKFEEK
jgi:hypothetical protein